MGTIFKTSLFVSASFIVGTLASTCFAEEDFDTETYIECGTDVKYGSAPIFKMEFGKWGPEQWGVMASQSDFKLNESGEVALTLDQGCHITRIEAKNDGSTVFSNPSLSCSVTVDTSREVVKSSSHKDFENCQFHATPQEIVARMRELDKAIAFSK